MQGLNDQVLRHSGFRIASPRPELRYERRPWQSVAGAIAVHAGLAVLLILLGHAALPPVKEEPPALTMVFAPPPPPPQAAPVQPPPEPPPPPEPEVNPFPPMIALPEPVPPPPPPLPEPKPEPKPEPLPLPRPKPEPRPAPVRQPPPPRPPPPVQRPQPPRVTPKPETRMAVVAPPMPLPSVVPAPAPPAPAPPPRAAAPVASNPEAMAGWRGALAAWLQSHKGYPEMAREKGDQGRVLVRFTVERDGRVLNVELVQSSGSDILDNAAEILLRSARLPPFPAAMPQNQISVTLPIHYALEH